MTAPLLARLIALADEDPDTPAVVTVHGPAQGVVRARTRSRRALLRSARRLSSTLASSLAAAGAGRGETVAVMLPRSEDWLTAVIGCMYGAMTPLPIDPALPVERRRAYLRRASVTHVIARRADKATEGLTVHTVTFDDAVPPSLIGAGPAPVDDGDLAWLIFTSGSTGRPKGVLVEHRGVVPFLEAQVAAFALGPESRSLWILSPGFDASMSDVFAVLLAGGVLYVDEDLDVANPQALFRTVAAHSITHVDVPPAILPHLDPDLAPPSLRTVVIGGEVADADAVRRWATRVRLVNVYGPTETTVCSSLSVCTGAWQEAAIGMPIAGAEYRIVDGELWIGGLGVARGYLDDAALTTARFVTEDGRRYFRTGDRVHRDASGVFFYLGRLDRQVKVRGQLVAPEEIEVCLMRHPRVQRAAVTTEPMLVAHLVTDGAVSDDALRRHVGDALPPYMLPARFMRHASLPAHPNGKIDFAPLAENMPTLDALRTLVAESLGVANVSVDASFATLAGTSLAALEIAARAEALGLGLCAERLIAAESLQALADELDAPASDTSADDSVTVASLEACAAPLLDSLSDAAGKTDKADRAERGAILLTGATGGLGAQVAAMLAMHSDAAIVCLARDGQVPAAERVRAATHRHDHGHGHEMIDQARIRTLQGDVTRDRLGLSLTDYDALAGEVAHVVHLAARVDGVSPLRTLWPANVAGTARLLSFAAKGRAKRFTYASTLSVFVGTDEREGTFGEDCWPAPEARVYGGYAQSKVAAESLVRQAAPHLAGVQILRYGLLTGDARTGNGSDGGWLPRTIRGLAVLGAIPRDVDPALSFDMTPSSFAARVTARLVMRDTGSLSVFHVANTEPVTFSALCATLIAEGVRLDELSREAFSRRVSERLAEARRVDVGAAYLALGRALGGTGARRLWGLDLFEATRASFDSHRTRALLGPDGICPPPTFEMLRRYVRAVLREKPCISKDDEGVMKEQR